MRKMATAVRFYTKTYKKFSDGTYGHGKLTYRGNTVDQCIIKAMSNTGSRTHITSFTVMEKVDGKFKFGANIKMRDYIAHIFQ